MRPGAGGLFGGRAQVDDAAVEAAEGHGAAAEGEFGRTEVGDSVADRVLAPEGSSRSSSTARSSTSPRSMATRAA